MHPRNPMCTGRMETFWLSPSAMPDLSSYSRGDGTNSSVASHAAPAQQASTASAFNLAATSGSMSAGLWDVEAQTQPDPCRRSLSEVPGVVRGTDGTTGACMPSTGPALGRVSIKTPASLPTVYSGEHSLAALPMLLAAEQCLETGGTDKAGQGEGQSFTPASSSPQAASDHARPPSDTFPMSMPEGQAAVKGGSGRLGNDPGVQAGAAGGPLGLRAWAKGLSSQGQASSINGRLSEGSSYSLPSRASGEQQHAPDGLRSAATPHVHHGRSSSGSPAFLSLDTAALASMQLHQDLRSQPNSPLQRRSLEQVPSGSEAVRLKAFSRSQGLLSPPRLGGSGSYTPGMLAPPAAAMTVDQVVREIIPCKVEAGRLRFTSAGVCERVRGQRACLQLELG